MLIRLQIYILCCTALIIPLKVCHLCFLHNCVTFAGDLWSYNPEKDTYVVSPEPDICSFDLDTKKHKCIIIASDGLWNMVKPQEALDIIRPFVSIKTIKH